MFTSDFMPARDADGTAAPQTFPVNDEANETASNI